MLQDATAEALVERLAREQAEKRLPAITAAVARDDRLVWFGSAGEVDGTPPSRETQFRCGSITKTFVAVEVMRLRDEGLVDLDAPITTYLPELDNLRCSVAQLLSHTSGLRAETSGPWWERTRGGGFNELAASSIGPDDIVCPPGRRFHYSNVGYGVLGEMVARLRGEAWDDVIDRELLGPLGMLRTSTRPVAPFAPGLAVHPHADLVLAEPEHDAGAMAPAGQLWTTAEDLCRWAAVLSGSRPDLLSRDTAAEMRLPLAVNDVTDRPWTTAHGLGLQLFNDDGKRSFGHGGSMPGFLAMLRIESETKDTVVVLTNATSGMSQTIDQELLEIVRHREPSAPPTWRPMAGGLDDSLLGITGTWYWGTRAFVITARRDGVLDLTALTLGREASFCPAADGSFVGLSGYYEGETLKVVRRHDGTLSHLDIGSFILTRTPYDPAAGVPGGVDAAGWRGSAPESEHRHHQLGPRRRE